MTVSSMSRSLTRKGSKSYLVKLRAFFALLKSNTGKKSNDAREILEGQLIVFFVSLRLELRHKCCYHNHLDSCRTSGALADYDVG